LQNLKTEKPVLGVFNTGALPYSIDKNNSQALNTKPSLAEMAKVAIDQMKNHKDGFVLQIEAGKVD